MKLRFQNRVETTVLRKPVPTQLPKMQGSEVAALYRAARVGGDFFDFVQIGPNRLIFALLDIAGKRDEALDIAAGVQQTLRARAPQLFSKEDLNEADALTDLVLALNNSVLEAAGGVRCSPGMVGCYNEGLGIVYYINAGSVPALVKTDGAITVLEAGGLPLGLFSHATHDAQVCVLPEGSVLLLTSRGLLEVKAGGEEYGLARLKESLQNANGANAPELCKHVLQGVSDFIEQNKRKRLFAFGANSATNGRAESLGENDVTAVALLRCAVYAEAASAK